MPPPSPVGIRDADRPEQVFLPPGYHTEYGDLKFGAPECLPTVREYLVPGWSVGGLGCNEPPLPENSPQVSLVQRNQEIQTLAADTSDEAFAESVRLGRMERRFQDAQAHRLQGRIELGGVNGVAVVDEEPVRFLSRDGLPELLERPVRGGMSGDVAVSDPACSHFHDHENVQHPKAGCRTDEEITCQQALGMVVNKRHPTLRRGAATA